MVYVPNNLIIVTEKEYQNGAARYKNGIDEPYFKLIHRMKQLETPILPDGFALTEIGVKEFARHIGVCYEEGGISETDLQEYKNHPVYDPFLWVAVKDELTGKTVATGIAELDARIGEGVLEWIQVSPTYRGKGLGAYLVNELLSRLKGKADFVTVSGKIKNRTNPLKLYENCGFSEKVIWHVVCVKP